MTLCNQLRSQHARILLMLTEIESILDARPGGLDTNALHLKACHLTRWVMVHLAFEQTELYPLLQPLAGREDRGDCWLIGEEIAHILPLITAYESRFRHRQDIANQPDEFVEATFELARRLRDRIERETRVVYPLAERLPASTSGRGEIVTLVGAA